MNEGAMGKSVSGCSLKVSEALSGHVASPRDSDLRVTAKGIRASEIAKPLPNSMYKYTSGMNTCCNV